MLDNFQSIDISQLSKSDILSDLLSDVNSADIFSLELDFFDGIQLLGNKNGHFGDRGKIAVVIESWVGRFGNNFIQFSNALKFAKVTGIDFVFLPEHEFIGEFSLPTISAGPRDESANNYDYLLSSKFRPWPTKTYYQLFGHQFDSSVLGPLRESINLVRVDGISEKDLTCFIRSGDIFVESPNPRYGQPPLSFYKKVITEGSWENIFILGEDDKNPVVGALLEFCEDQNLNHDLVRRGMRRDFEFLLGSTNICGGFTSLLPAIATLSCDLTKSFSFETRIWVEGVQIEQINDAIGVYKDAILNDNWINSTEQLELMLSYPLENLESITIDLESEPNSQPLEAIKSFLVSSNGFSTRPELINFFSNVINAENYLEIGVLNGLTFSQIEAKNKTAVGPKFSCEPNTLGGSYYETTSNKYFETLDKNVKFDLIYLDGLHTFEQTLLDLLNSLQFLAPKGLIIVDDVYPSDYLASLPNHQLTLELKAKNNDIDRNWMGDVYKTVAFAKKFLTHLNYATTEGPIKQAIFWRNDRTRNEAVDPGTVQSISTLQFADLLNDSSFFNFENYKDIEIQIRKDLHLND